MPFFCCLKSAVAEDEPKPKSNARGSVASKGVANADTPRLVSPKRLSAVAPAPPPPSIVSEGHLSLADLAAVGRALEAFTGAFSSTAQHVEACVRAALEPLPSASVNDDDDNNDSDDDATAPRVGAKASAKKGLDDRQMLVDGAAIAAAMTALAAAHKTLRESAAASPPAEALVQPRKGGVAMWRTPATPAADGKGEARLWRPTGPFLSPAQRDQVLGTKDAHRSLRLVALALSALTADIARAVALRVIRKKQSLAAAVDAVVSALRGSGATAAGATFKAALPTAAISSMGLGGLEPLDVVAACVAFGLKLLCAGGGGPGTIFADDLRAPTGGNGDCEEGDLAVAAALEVGGICALVSLVRLSSCNPSAGMHSVAKVAEDLSAVRKLLAGVGALDTFDGDAGSGPAALAWMADLPAFALGDDARCALLYLGAVLVGQQSRKLSPVLRSSFLASAVAALKKATSQDIGLQAVLGNGGAEASCKIFPVFAKEGVGLESGEGHGPRKEFFDAAAFALTSSTLPEVDVSAAAILTVLRPEEARERGYARIPPHCGVVVIEWLKVKLVAQLAPGDRLRFRYSAPSEGGAAEAPPSDGRRSSPISRSASALSLDPEEPLLEYEATVHSVLSAPTSVSPARQRGVGQRNFGVGGDDDDEGGSGGSGEASEIASNADATIAVAINGFCPFTPAEMRRCAIARLAQPLFVHEAGKRYAWLNLGLAAAHGTALDVHSAFAGWALANAVANGVVLPVALSPYLFRALRSWLAAGGSPASRGHLWGASLLPTVEEAALVDPTLCETADQARSMNQATFLEVLAAEGLDGEEYKSGSFAQQLDRYVRNVVIGESVLPADLRGRMQLFAEGFATAGIHRCPVFAACSSRQLQRIFCGHTDDGKCDFRFSEHFTFMWDEAECSPTSRFEHARLFARVVMRVIDDDVDATTKRRILQFITGRKLLPPRPRTEHIKLEFPLAPMTARDFDAALARLPSSHSCDNVFELPNYPEAVLFGSERMWYAIQDAHVAGAVVLDHHREQCWALLSERQRALVERETARVLKRKLVQAVLHSETYELDDNVVDDKQRRLFDACFTSVERSPSTANAAGVAAALPPLGPSGMTSARRHAKPETPATSQHQLPSARGNNGSTPHQQQTRSTARRLESLHTVNIDAVAAEEPAAPIPQLRTSIGSSADLAQSTQRTSGHSTPRGSPSPTKADPDSGGAKRPPRSGSRPGEDIDDLMDELFPNKR